ncbi:MAG: hypothetical protein Q9163_005036 [Psora crenata]
MAEVIYSGAHEASDIQGKLFDGIKFWLSQRVPQRSRFVDDVRANGGEVVLLEKQADVRIVDHARKEALPGTHSYTYIEKSIRNACPENLEDHVVGPPEGTVRSIGSIAQPPKVTRNKYTPEDDCILWDWVNTNPQKIGGTDGNEIYKQLEAKHPQHPWQSWRDRYRKFLKGKPRPYAVPHNAPPTPPLDFNAAQSKQEELRAASHAPQDASPDFTEEDAQSLMDVGEDILNVRPERKGEAWRSWVDDIDPEGGHSAEQWEAFWEESVRPRYLDRKGRQAQQALNVDGRPQDARVPVKPSSEVVSVAIPPPKQTMNSKLPLRSPSYRRTVSNKPTEQQQPMRFTDQCDRYAVAALKGSKEHTGIESYSSPTVKRKHTEFEEDLPPSSPPQAALSPKRIRQSFRIPHEIASTPDTSPAGRIRREASPLFTVDDEEEEEAFGSGDHEDGSVPSYYCNEQDRPSNGSVSETHSAPGGTRKDTQALFREPTPLIDFDVPSPDDGWVRHVPGKGGAEVSDYENPPSATRPHESVSAVPDTQAIFEGETQIPDFDFPAPDGGWNSPTASLPPQIPHSPQGAESVASSSNVSAQLDAWIETFEAKGFSSETVETVLKCTTLDGKLAEEVLESLRKGKRKSTGNDANGIPIDWRGVWTVLDDEDLLSTDARKVKRLEDKHGLESVKARWEFLAFFERG